MFNSIMNKLIAINGKIGSGKSTFTNMFLLLCDMNDISSEELYFAYKLKKIVAELANVPFSLTLTQEGKNTFIEMFNMTIGEMLQDIGTRVMRDNFDADVWAKSTIQRYKNSTKNCVVVSDLRFMNEAEYLQKENAIFIKIVGESKIDVTRNKNHISETELNDFKFDYTIYNDGTKLDFYKKIIDIFKSIYDIDNPITYVSDIEKLSLK